MSNFMSALKNEMNNELCTTENGAVGYKTTGTKLVDLNFAVASLRKKSKEEIADMFIGAYYENPMLAIKWLFYLRDITQGLGERRSFRVIMNYLARQHEDIALAVLNLIPEYGRWDDLVELLDCNNANVSNEILTIIKTQLNKDIVNRASNKPISLLGKWLPSENASSKNTKRKASIIRDYLNLTPRNYRLTLSALRNYLDVVECKMSAKEWNEINYSSVPSKANLCYANAFMRNDEERRRAYLESLKKGETKINAGVLFPHDVVHKYNNNHHWWYRVGSYDETLEQMWKSLKDMGGIKNTIVVADGSGSMGVMVDNNSSVSALEVANALAIYCGERCSGEFKDKYITFSSRPQLVDFTNAKSLHDKLEIAYRHNEVANTNIEAVFDLILSTAINNHMTQDEIPQNILILSDNEFDCMVEGNPTVSLFKQIATKYNKAGYDLPRLIFWNLNSRTNTIPMKQNKLGVTLVSGFSANVMNMVLNNELDPYKALLKELNKDRYLAIEECLEGVI
jgi:hypothetical protein